MARHTHLHDVVKGMKMEDVKNAARTIGISLTGAAKKEAAATRLATALVRDADAVSACSSAISPDGTCADIP